MVIRIVRLSARNIHDVIGIETKRIRATCRAGRGLLDVERRSTEIRHSWGRIHILHCPLLTSGLELLHVADAGRALGLITILHEVRDRNSGQNGDDGDHDHDFDEGKTLLH